MLRLRDLKPGVTLGRYEILMPVAQGGMAAVWAARMVGSRGFQKIVAVKTMLPGLSEDPDFEAMFLDEARLASRIRHPHVAEILDLGDENGWLYLVMEWVNGETLFVLNRAAKEKGGFPLPLLLRILSSACAGLHAAHELRDDDGRPLGLVHRDVNPQNVMVSYDGIVKIVDFGVAKATGRAAITRVPGMMKGKAHYMSPEQIRADPIDRRSDIFSLGILMYVMITGRHPFKAATDADTMDNIIGAELVPIHVLAPDVNPDLEAVVTRALSKNPADRFPDCAEMQRALDQITNTIGAAVTDGDVASFLRNVMGERSKTRRAEISAAIQAADARAAAPIASEPPPSRARAGVPSSRGGASLEGIIPIALDDGNDKPAAPPPSARPIDAPPLSRAPTVLVQSQRRRSSVLALLGIALLGAIGGAAFALRAGLLPGVEPRLPEALRFLKPPPPAASTPAPPPSASAAPPPSASATAEAIAPLDAGADVEDEGALDASADVADADADALDADAPDADALDAASSDGGDAGPPDGGYLFLPPNPGGGWKRVDGYWYPPPWWRPNRAAPAARPIDPTDPYGGG